MFTESGMLFYVVIAGSIVLAVLGTALAYTNCKDRRDGPHDSAKGNGKAHSPFTNDAYVTIRHNTLNPK